MVTVHFPQSDAQTIDNDYDDGNSRTGAFRVTGEIHPEDPLYAKFKAKYMADIRNSLDIFKDMPKYMELYNGIKDLAPAKAKAEADAAKAKAEADAAKAKAEADADAAKAKTNGITDSKLFTGGALNRIPATWFFDYVDKLEFDPNAEGPRSALKLGDVLQPLLDPSDNNYVSLENLQTVATAFVPTDIYHDLSRANASEEYNNYVGQSRETELVALAGDADTLANIRSELITRVIPHFQNDTHYITYQSTNPAYTLNAFIDPKGFVSVKIFKDQSSYPIFTLNHALHDDAKSLNEMLGSSADLTLILQAFNTLDQYLKSKDTKEKASRLLGQACYLDTTLIVIPNAAVSVEVALVEEAPLTFSGAKKVSNFIPLVYGNKGMQSIPAEWFDAYVDKNSDVSTALAPIRDTLYDPATNYKVVSLANLNDVSDSFDTAAPTDELIPAWDLWSRGVAFMQSIADSQKQAIIADMASDANNFSTVQSTIMDTVIPHFVADTSYHVFEFTTQRGSATPQTYTVYSFVDPQGSIDIRIARGTIDENNVFFLTPEDLSKLDEAIGKSPDKEIIYHGLELARGLLEDGSAAETAFNERIQLSNP